MLWLTRIKIVWECFDYTLMSMLNLKDPMSMFTLSLMRRTPYSFQKDIGWITLVYSPDTISAKRHDFKVPRAHSSQHRDCKSLFVASSRLEGQTLRDEICAG